MRRPEPRGQSEPESSKISRALNGQYPAFLIDTSTQPSVQSCLRAISEFDREVEIVCSTHLEETNPGSHSASRMQTLLPTRLPYQFVGITPRPFAAATSHIRSAGQATNQLPRSFDEQRSYSDPKVETHFRTKEIDHIS